MVIAFLLAGVGLLVAQLPYGRLGTALAACIIGALLGTVSWFGSQHPKYPAIATILNGLVLLVAPCLHLSWLGSSSWQDPSRRPRTCGRFRIVGARRLREKPKESDWLDIEAQTVRAVR